MWAGGDSDAYVARRNVRAHQAPAVLTFTDCPALGRFAVLDNNIVHAVGIVTKLEVRPPPFARMVWESVTRGSRVMCCDRTTQPRTSSIPPRGSLRLYQARQPRGRAQGWWPVPELVPGLARAPALARSQRTTGPPTSHQHP